MNLLQKIVKAFSSSFNGQVTYNASLPVIRLVNQAVYAEIDTQRAFQKAFAENAIYFGVIDRIAEKFGHIPRYVYKPEPVKKKAFRTKALDENIADGELMQLLLKPNDYQGQDQFFYLCALSYKATGECFIWKNRGGIEGGRPLELYVIPPWLLTPVSDGTMYGIASFLLEINGQRIYWPKEDVIYWKKPALSLDATGAHLRGFNPMIPHRKLLTQIDSITDASVGMFQAGGAKGALANESLDNISEAQMDDIKSVIDRKINRTDAKGSVVAIQGKWSYLNMGLSSVDMDLLAAEEAVVKKICFSLGFPPELYQSDSTFANKEQAWQFFITNTLMPMCASFDGELNRSLLADFGEKGRIGTDFSDLPEMQAMSVKLVEAANKAWWKTPDEKRGMTMDEPLGTPEMQKIYIPSGFVPIDEASIGDPMQQGDNGGY